MSEWEKFKLNEILILVGGGTPKTSNPEYWNGDIPWLSVVDFGNKTKKVYNTEKTITEKGLKESSTKILKKGQIIISARGTVGELAVLGKDMAFNQSCYGIYANEKTENNFLYYLLKESLGKIKKHTHGAVFDTITKQTFENIEIEIPVNILEQTKIADILSSLDDKIELNLQMNQTLETMAQTIFKEWFVSEAKEDWQKVKLGELIEIKGGFSYEGKYIGTGDALLLGMGCVSFSERFLLTGARPYSGESSKNHLVYPGDIVIATRQQSDNLPILGFPARVPISLEGKKVIVGTNLYKVNNDSEISNSILFQLFKSEEYKNHILANSKGSTVRMITKDSIELFEIKLPPKETIKKCELILQAIDNKIEINKAQIQTLTQTRDSLMPKLMSGKIEILNL